VKRRLGSQGGVASVKKDPWFSSGDWNKFSNKDLKEAAKIELAKLNNKKDELVVDKFSGKDDWSVGF